MLSVEQRAEIRRAYYVEKRSVRQIARETGYARKTVKKALKSTEPVSYTLRKPRSAPVLGPGRRV